MSGEQKDSPIRTDCRHKGVLGRFYVRFVPGESNFRNSVQARSCYQPFVGAGPEQLFHGDAKEFSHLRQTHLVQRAHSPFPRKTGAAYPPIQKPLPLRCVAACRHHHRDSEREITSPMEITRAVGCSYEPAYRVSRKYGVIAHTGGYFSGLSSRLESCVIKARRPAGSFSQKMCRKGEATQSTRDSK